MTPSGFAAGRASLFDLDFVVEDRRQPRHRRADRGIRGRAGDRVLQPRGGGGTVGRIAGQAGQRVTDPAIRGNLMCRNGIEGTDDRSHARDIREPRPRCDRQPARTAASVPLGVCMTMASCSAPRAGKCCSISAPARPDWLPSASQSNPVNCARKYG